MSDDKSTGVLPVNETQLRHLTRKGLGTFEILAVPLIDGKDLWWTLRLRLPDQVRDLLLVDALNTPRRWRQGNALLRFVILVCGRDHTVTWNLVGVRADHLFTRGQKREPSRHIN